MASQLLKKSEAKHEAATVGAVHHVVGIVYAYVLFIAVQLGIFGFSLGAGFSMFIF